MQIRSFLLSVIIWLFYKALSLTWRVRIYEPPEMIDSIQRRSPLLLAHWHGDELALIHLSPRYRIATIASKSKDGELMARVLRWLGAATSRGSSSKGAVGALKGLLDLTKDGRNISFAVDGPRGPIYQVKPGVFEFSRIREIPIYTVGLYCDRFFLFKRSWNQAYLPKPFAKIGIYWQGPIPGLTKNQDPRAPELAENLRNQLFDAKQRAVNLFAEG